MPMTAASRTWPPTDSTSRTAGATSDDSVSSTSRRGLTSVRRSTFGSVNAAIDGCSAAAPHAA
jgi:hypothetical protein